MHYYSSKGDSKNKEHQLNSNDKYEKIYVKKLSKNSQLFPYMETRQYVPF